MLTLNQMGFTVRPTKRKPRTAVLNIEHPNLPNVYFTLYYRGPGRYLWRRTAYPKNDYGNFSKWRQHPLNMIGRKPHELYHDYRPYNIRLSEFATWDEAIAYFCNYIKKYYPNIINKEQS